MHSPPTRFILQAIDPEHGSSAFETMLRVGRVEDLRTLLGDAAEDDPDLERWYPLTETELAAINRRFGACFDPMGREAWLVRLHGVFDAPYLIHTCYELPLLLEDRKKLAVFNDAYPPEEHWNECYFTPTSRKACFTRKTSSRSSGPRFERTARGSTECAPSTTRPKARSGVSLLTSLSGRPRSNRAGTSNLSACRACSSVTKTGRWSGG